MNINLIKKHLYFLLICLFFLISIIYSLIIWQSWGTTVPKKYDIEVSLPVINWQNYSSLSKQYNNGNIEVN